MVNTVKRGAGRPAATARSNKAAQRTPLPPRPGQISDEMLAEAAHRVQLEDMTAVQLRAYAREKGFQIPGLSKMAKDGVLREILAAEDDTEVAEAEEPTPEEIEEEERHESAKDDGFSSKSSKAKEVAQQQRNAKEIAEVTAKRHPEITPAAKALGGTKSAVKAQTFCAEAVKLGWDSDAKSEGESTTVVATRGDESLEISWLGGVFQGETCVYHHAGRTAIKIHNASAAKKRMALPPEQAAEEARKVTAHKAIRGGVRKSSPGARRVKDLPFSEASLDQEVLNVLYGKKITWLNGTSATEESDRVPSPQEVRKSANAPKIGEGPRGRFITFPGQSGFRDVLLSSITEVR